MTIHNISTQQEFDALLVTHPDAIFFVDSTWSAISKLALQQWMEFIPSHPALIPFVIIDNASGESFVYQWLFAQGQKNAVSKPWLPQRTNGSWIHGKGESFRVQDGTLMWFLNRFFHVADFKLDWQTLMPLSL